ncbi:MAG TPA: ADOP family duplicated permease [Bryobacteraceae bacterium]|jgi:putative ABC transport system permease protein|nr:ADOP family duplicated permease [Bryobacteraceae bacterium]
MDLRYALRILSRSPGFSAIAILTLALGIGINTIVFTLYSAVALKPIAARAPEQLVRISGSQNGQRTELFAYWQYQQILREAHFSDVIVSSEPQVLAARLPEARESDLVRARLVSNNYFGALGISPALGRGFLPDDREAAVISHDFWIAKLNADPEVLTKIIQVRGVTLHIIGVAPAKFAGTGAPPRMPDLWIPSAAQTEVLPGVDWLHDETARQWQVLARREIAVPVAQASAEMEVLARSWPLVEGQPAHLNARPATFFQTDKGGEFDVFAAVCGILMVAVGLILLIGSINLVNLLFARHAAREREFAVRRALGASRFHLVRQLCTESLLLGLLGGAAGLLFSLWACEWIRVGISGMVERISIGALGVFFDVAPDWRVFAFTAAISLVTGVAIGLWPAIRASLSDVSRSLQQSSFGAAGGRRKRNLLIGAQVAACLMLLAGAGLLFRGALRSSAIDPGFDLRHTLVVGITSHAVAPTAAAQAELVRHAVDRMAAIPGVVSVAWADRAPFLAHGTGDFTNERRAVTNCLFNFVSGSYFETLGIPLVAGRNFTRQEVENPGPVVMINEVAARQAWPGQDPIGHRVSGVGWLKGFLPPSESFTVIGVVKGVRSTFLSKPDEAYLYFPKPLGPGRALMVRTRSTPESTSRAIFSELGAINPNLPAQTFLVPLDKAPIEIQRWMAEAPALTAFILGALALLLAALGVFGVVSQLVTQRTREIAIRVSLGAQVGDVIRMVMGQTLRPVLLGAAAGLAGALGISGLLARLLVAPDMPDLTYGSGAFDPLTFSGVLSVLTLVILIACFVPVRRATRIAPADALRNE